MAAAALPHSGVAASQPLARPGAAATSGEHEVLRATRARCVRPARALCAVCICARRMDRRPASCWAAPTAAHGERVLLAPRHIISAHMRPAWPQLHG